MEEGFTLAKKLGKQEFFIAEIRDSLIFSVVAV